LVSCLVEIDSSWPHNFEIRTSSWSFFLWCFCGWCWLVGMFLCFLCFCVIVFLLIRKCDYLYVWGGYAWNMCDGYTID